MRISKFCLSKTLGALLLASFASGCATRSVVDVTVPRADAPATQYYVAIVQVNDRRSFEASPRNPSVPSLENPAEIQDRAIRSRAIARKRNGWGQAMGDILLPERSTVEELVRQAMTTALRESGYAVVEDKSNVSEKPIPLSIDIQQFWSWFTPGVPVSMEFESILVIKNEKLLTNPGEPVRGYAIVRAMGATDSGWQRTVQEGIADLIHKLKARIRRPPEIGAATQQ